MKVLHIAPTPFFSNRGCHIRIFCEAEVFAEKGVHPIICTYGLGDDLKGLDIRRIYSIPGYKKRDAGFSPFKIVADLYLFFLVIGVVFKEKPAAIHGHLHEGVLIGFMVKIIFFWRKLPLFFDLQGSLSGELVAYGTVKQKSLLKKIIFLVEKWVCRLPDYIFCSSLGARKFLIEGCDISENKVALLEDGISISFDQVRTGESELISFPEDTKVIIYTGALLQGKGTRHLEYLIKRMKGDDCFDWHLLLLGYPTGHFEALIKKYGVESRVTLLGEQLYSNLGSYLKLADIALDPKESLSGEASGKIIHYIAAGLPVVCFDTPNNLQLLGELGFFAKSFDSESFFQVLKKALSSSQGDMLLRKKLLHRGNEFSWRKKIIPAEEVYKKMGVPFTV